MNKYLLLITGLFLIFSNYQISANENTEKDMIQNISENNSISEKIIYAYFGFDLGTGYEEAEEIIQKSNLRYIKKDNMIKVFGKLTGDMTIESTVMYFNNGFLSNIMIYIDQPVTYINYYHDKLKKIIDLDYADDSMEKVIWTNSKISFEINYSKEHIKSKKMICFKYYINEYKVNKYTDYRAFSISVGGNINQNIGFIIYPSRSFIDGNFIDSFELGVPLTITGYTGPKFGIGVTYIPGFRMVFNMPPHYPYLIEMSHRLMISNKIGKIDKFYFIIEYGLGLLLKFTAFKSFYFWENPYDKIVTLGCAFFTGFEKRIGKNFLLSFGGTLNCYFGNVNKPGITDDIHLGLEIRLRYDYFKYIK